MNNLKSRIFWPAKVLLCGAGMALLTLPLRGDMNVLFADTGDIANFTVLGTPPASGAAEVDGTATIGSGTALRIWDLDTTDKGEAWLDLAAPITDGFRLEFTAHNVTVSGKRPCACASPTWE